MFLNLVDFLFRLPNHQFLVDRSLEVIGGEAQSAAGGLAETDVFHPVEQIDGFAATEMLITIGDNPAQMFARQRQIVEGHVRLENVVENDAAHGCGHEHVGIA